MQACRVKQQFVRHQHIPTQRVVEQVVIIGSVHRTLYSALCGEKTHMTQDMTAVKSSPALVQHF